MSDTDALVAERGAVYGHPRKNFTLTARLWGPILGVEVTAEQVALCMIALKVARLCESPQHDDSIADVKGYAKTLEMLRDG
jgi:hypothetical protein